MPAYQNLVGSAPQAPRAAFAGAPSGGLGSNPNPYAPGSPAFMEQQRQTNVRTQAEATAAQRDRENRAAEVERTRMAMSAQQNALTKQSSEMNNPQNSWGTNGESLNVSNGGSSSGYGNSSRSSGGSSGSYGDGGASAKPAFDVNAAIQQFQSSFPQVAPPPQVSLPQTAAPQVPQASGMFAHAKDVSGRVGNKALEAFRNLMSKRGMSGSGMESEGEAGILGQVATQQAGSEYDQANLNNARQWEANQMGYQGDMGQNATSYQGALSQNAMGYQGALEQRNQGIQALMQLIQMGARY